MPVDEVEVRWLRRRNRQLKQGVEIVRRATAYFARYTLPTRPLCASTVPPGRALRWRAYARRKFS